jgi:tetratricopeptide (TPR) repeat protein
MTIRSFKDSGVLEAWCARVQRLLELGNKGVLVLLQGAGPEHLGPLARSLWSREPAHVCLNAAEIEDLAPGTLVVLPVASGDGDWLNAHRPLFAHRRLRVVLLADDQTTQDLARGAPDFFDWISHVVPSPKVLQTHLVVSLNAYRAAPGIHFCGAEPQPYLREAYPDRAFHIVSPSASYEGLVQALVAAQGQRVVLSADVHPVRLRWAMAEARHTGGVVASFAVPGWPSLDASPVSFHARAQSLNSGSGDLMAAVDAEPEALILANALKAEGWSTPDLLEAAKASQDGGAALASLQLQANPQLRTDAGLWDAPSPTLRAYWSGQDREAQHKLRNQDIEARLNAGEVVSRLEIAAWAAATQSTPLALPNLAASPDLVPAVEPILRLPEVPWRGLAGVATNVGHYDVAETWAGRAVQLAECTRDDRQISDALLVLANAKSHQGKYKEAEGLFRQSLKIDERALGKDHPSYGTSLQALAGVLSKQGEVKESEALLRQSLKIYERALGKHHPAYGASLHALAGVLGSQGEYKEAEAFLRRSLKIAERALGQDHPSLAATCYNLGVVLAQTGRLAEAERSVRRALNILLKVHGPDHPDVATVSGLLSSYRGAPG